MNPIIKVKGTDGTLYTVFTSHIIFYESVSKPFYDSEEHTWRDSEEGSIIHLSNNFNPINTTQTKSEIDDLLLNQ
tara:strand:+ start:576 stop:800 length:225 start_codon:yes stop_codon:yes gene_type:complete